MNDQKTRGILYVAMGQAHVDVARRSAQSAKRANPGIGTAIFCGEDDDASGFDQAFVIPDGLTRPKVDLLPDSPFDETLYLDNDTLVRTDITSMFDLLDKFDMCGSHVQLWHRPRHNKKWRVEVPDAFPEINCGVLLYRKVEATKKFFRDWSNAFAQAGFGVDQVTFRELLWSSDLNFYVFPPQYNKRVFEASELIYSDQPRARIFHLELLQPQKNRFLAWIANRIR
jgi:hypothetical protein